MDAAGNRDRHSSMVSTYITSGTQHCWNDGMNGHYLSICILGHLELLSKDLGRRIPYYGSYYGYRSYVCQCNCTITNRF